MKPELMDGEYVFCTIQREDLQKVNPDALGIFQEKEGATLILKKEIAEKNNYSYRGIWSLITCTVHSDLSAVGFLAAITGKLARAGISVNVVSACYHDHLFVPVEKASRALEILKKFSRAR